MSGIMRPARWCSSVLSVLSALYLAFFIAAMPVQAETIKNPVARFAGLDKITAKVTEFDVVLDKSRMFGNLRVTARACHTRPPVEPPETLAFVEIEEIYVDKENPPKRIFTGWMYASSPALHALEHPVYDVWLISCKRSVDE